MKCMVLLTVQYILLKDKDTVRGRERERERERERGGASKYKMYVEKRGS